MIKRWAFSGWALLTMSVLGCAGKSQSSDTPSVLPARLEAGAWDIEVTATPTEQPVAPNAEDASPTFTFTLSLIGEGANLSGILSRSGAATRFGLVRVGDSSVKLDNTADLVLPLGSSFESALTRLTFHSLNLNLTDAGSSSVSALVGQGEGKLGHGCGDCEFDSTVHLALTGTPDSTPPRLTLPSAPLNPLDIVSLVASEALQSASLALSGTTSTPLASSAAYAVNEAVPMLFGSQEILPFAGNWSVTGNARDFADQALDLSAMHLSTLADPGIFAADGFENSVLGVLTGQARVVDASSGFAIPSGKHALLLEPGSSAAFHLRRSAAQRNISATIVELEQGVGGSAYGLFEAGAIGGTLRETVRWTSNQELNATSNPIWVSAHTAVTASATLTEAGDDVVIRLAPSQLCGGFCPPPTALLVDDLKIE